MHGFFMDMKLYHKVGHVMEISSHFHFAGIYFTLLGIGIMPWISLYHTLVGVYSGGVYAL